LDEYGIAKSVNDSTFTATRHVWDGIQRTKHYKEYSAEQAPSCTIKDEIAIMNMKLFTDKGEPIRDHIIEKHIYDIKQFSFTRNMPIYNLKEKQVIPFFNVPKGEKCFIYFDQKDHKTKIDKDNIDDIKENSLYCTCAGEGHDFKNHECKITVYMLYDQLKRKDFEYIKNGKKTRRNMLHRPAAFGY